MSSGELDLLFPPTKQMVAARSLGVRHGWKKDEVLRWVERGENGGMVPPEREMAAVENLRWLLGRFQAPSFAEAAEIGRAHV